MRTTPFSHTIKERKNEKDKQKIFNRDTMRLVNVSLARILLGRRGKRKKAVRSRYAGAAIDSDGDFGREPKRRKAIFLKLR
jgi:hypothetical protein